MLFEHRSKCRDCLFGWGRTGNSSKEVYCECYLISGSHRQNTAQKCQSFIKRPKTFMSDKEKIEYYKEAIKNGRRDKKV